MNYLIKPPSGAVLFYRKKGEKMELKDTIELMTSEDYKDRFIAEYQQTKIRYDKLHKMLVRYDAGTLTFEPTNISLLREQAAAMGRYLYLLEERAELEQIEL